MADWLERKSVLVILDNFEQVVEAAPLVADLLRVAPGLKALVTSTSRDAWRDCAWPTAHGSS